MLRGNVGAVYHPILIAIERVSFIVVAGRMGARVVVGALVQVGHVVEVGPGVNGRTVGSVSRVHSTLAHLNFGGKLYKP